jgi:hypothetical protein
MFTCLLVSPRDIRCHIAGIIVDEVQRAVVDAQPERHRVTRSTILSKMRASANEGMMPTLWLSICGVILRDLDFGAHASAVDDHQRAYVDAISEACHCLYSEKPVQVLKLLESLPMTVVQSSGCDTVGRCVWEIAHSLRVALYLAAHCEVSRANSSGAPYVFPIMAQLPGQPLRAAGPIDLVASLAGAAVVHAMNTCGELGGWLAFEEDGDAHERMQRQAARQRFVATSLFKQFVILISRY